MRAPTTRPLLTLLLVASLAMGLAGGAQASTEVARLIVHAEFSEVAEGGTVTISAYYCLPTIGGDPFGPDGIPGTGDDFCVPATVSWFTPPEFGLVFPATGTSTVFTATAAGSTFVGADDGFQTDAVPITIGPAADPAPGGTIVTDATDPTKTELRFLGTAGHDVVQVRHATGSASVEVVLNGVVHGPFAPTGRLVIDGRAGDDVITIDPRLARTAWVLGGPGDDRVEAGNGSSVLLGGDGNDFLLGGNGRDILVGGTGSDVLSGGNGEDILVGGDVAFDALAAILAEWTREDRPYQDRIESILSSVPRFFGDADGFADDLRGDNGLDWFLADAADAVGASFGETITFP